MNSKAFPALGGCSPSTSNDRQPTPIHRTGSAASAHLGMTPIRQYRMGAEQPQNGHSVHRVRSAKSALQPSMASAEHPSDRPRNDGIGHLES
jgi:hypothetical protein